MKKYEAVIILNPNLSSKVDSFIKDFEKLWDFIEDITGSLSKEYANVSIFFFKSFKTSSIILCESKLFVLVSKL